MIHILHNKLNQNEVFVLESLLKKTQYPYWKIYDLSLGEFPSLSEGAESFEEKVILVFDETKGKSAFEKTLDALYNVDGAVSLFKNSIRIDRPNTYKGNLETVQEVWNKIVSLCNIKVTKISKLELPDNINRNFQKMLETVENGSAFIFTDEAGNEIEVVPDNVPPSKKISLTFRELLVLVAYRSVFQFDHLEIIKPV